jgi:hypothetical protein
LVSSNTPKKKRCSFPKKLNEYRTNSKLKLTFWYGNILFFRTTLLFALTLEGFWWRRVFGRGNKEEKGEGQDDVLAFSHVLEQLEEEIQTLNGKRENLLNVEAALLFFVNKKIEAKKTENQALRLEVEKQKANCVKLANVLNASIKASYSIPWYLAESSRLLICWFDFLVSVSEEGVIARAALQFKEGISGLVARVNFIGRFCSQWVFL